MNTSSAPQSHPASFLAGNLSLVFIRCLLFAAASLMLAQNASATLWCEDGITGTVGNSLGAAAPYFTSSTQIKIASGNLTFTGLADPATVGNEFVILGTSASGTYRTNTATAITSGSVYYSFLVQCTTQPGASAVTFANLNTTPAIAGSSDSLCIYTKSSGAGFVFGIRKNGASTAFATTPTVMSLNTTYLIVVKYVFNTGSGTDDTVTLYINPTPGGTEPVTPEVTLTGGTDTTGIQFLGWKSQSSGGGAWTIDSLRTASTWGEVTPASGVCNGASASAPANASVVTGQPATFNTSAGTSSSPTFQWQKSTTAAGSTYTNIPSATFASYTNLVTTAADNGFNYRCVVSVACGGGSTATSAAAMLTVSCNTVGISSQPSAASVFAGQTANFSLTATGSTPTYQWQRSTTTADATYTNISSATNASYTTPVNTLGNDGFYYRCVVSVACDGSSVTSSAVLLSVTCNTAGITAAPTDVTAILGATAAFTITASGSNPAYQWELSTDGGTTWSPVGTSTNVYTTPTTTLADGGKKYRCTVSVACDGSSQTSPGATLSVVDPSASSFRSVASGSWQNIATWQLSTNNGVSWVAASTPPTAANSTNILISASTTVTNLAASSADQIVVASGGTLVCSNTLSVASSGSAVDLDVLGTVLVLGGSSTLTLASGVAMVVESGGVFAYDGTSSSGSVSSSGATITIASGGKFQLRRAGGTVPVLTWNTGSTCEIAYSTASNSKPNGISQTFANFTWNNPLQNGSVDLAGTLTNINGNFLLTAANGQEIKWSGDANFGGNLTINDGSLNVSGNATPRVWTLTGDLTIGASGTFTVTATANALSQIILNGTGTQNYTCSGVNSATKLFWTVNSGSILNLNNDLAITTTGRALTNNGTVNLNGKNLLTDLVSGTGTVRNQGGGSGKLVIGVGNSTNTLDGTLALLDGASGTLSLVKGGNSGTAGLLNITTPNTFSGGLVVSNGLCFVNNSTGSGTGSGGISVINGTLGGTGAVTGPVTFTGGKLSPGVDGVSIGTFTVNGTLTLVGNTTMDVNKGVGQDQVVATTVNYSGLLTIVTNGSAFVAGDTFNLFTAGSHTANFGSITNNPGDGLAWAFNPTNGVLSVILSAPPVLGTSLSGGVLTFTWTASGFKLQSQTNNLTTGLGTNWFDYPGGGTSPVGVTIDPASPSVFFRLSQ